MLPYKIKCTILIQFFIHKMYIIKWNKIPGYYIFISRKKKPTCTRDNVIYVDAMNTTEHAAVFGQY